jgi:multicomponent Na+:H+ antiporter subunit D
MKITLFFAAGAVMHQSGRIYVTELDGFGYAMPKTFAIFTAGALALTGIPPLCGFYSKYAIASAAVSAGGPIRYDISVFMGSPVAYAGIAALLISAIFTAVYLLSVCVRAFFPAKDFDRSSLEGGKDPNLYMIAPLAALALMMILLGLFPGLAGGFAQAAAEQVFGAAALL